MSLKNIAVQGCTLSEPTAQIITPTCTKVKCDGKLAYCGDLTIQITGYSSAIITVPGSGSGSDTLSGSAKKVKIEGKPAVLEGDNVTIKVYGKAYAGTSTIDVMEPVNVRITSAGQTKVKGS